MRTVFGAVAMVFAYAASASANPGDGIAFAEQWMPWVLDQKQVGLYLQALKGCQEGDARFCKMIDLMLPATAQAPSGAAGGRCLSVPLGDGSYGTRCF
jgi:hypothetical protein